MAQDNSENVKIKIFELLQPFGINAEISSELLDNKFYFIQYGGIRTPINLKIHHYDQETLINLYEYLTKLQDYQLLNFDIIKLMINSPRIGTFNNIISLYKQNIDLNQESPYYENFSRNPDSNNIVEIILFCEKYKIEDQAFLDALCSYSGYNFKNLIEAYELLAKNNLLLSYYQDLLNYENSRPKHFYLEPHRNSSHEDKYWEFALAVVQLNNAKLLNRENLDIIKNNHEQSPLEIVHSMTPKSSSLFKSTSSFVIGGGVGGLLGTFFPSMVANMFLCLGVSLHPALAMIVFAALVGVAFSLSHLLGDYLLSEKNIQLKT